MEEVLKYFWVERSWLEREVKTKKRGQRKAIQSLSALPSVLLWKCPWKWFFRRFLVIRKNGIEQEISLLKQRINRYLQAEAELKKGNYTPAISLLDALLDKLPAIFTTGIDFDGKPEEIPNPMFYHVLELRKQLIELRG